MSRIRLKLSLANRRAPSCAAPLTSAQLIHLSCLVSFHTVLLHVVLGRPTFFFSLCHTIANMQLSFLPFLSTRPIPFHLLLRISSLIFFTPQERELKSIQFLLLSSRLFPCFISIQNSWPTFVFRTMLRVFQIFYRL